MLTDDDKEWITERFRRLNGKLGRLFLRASSSTEARQHRQAAGFEFDTEQIECELDNLHDRLKIIEKHLNLVEYPDDES